MDGMWLTGERRFFFPENNILLSMIVCDTTTLLYHMDMR